MAKDFRKQKSPAEKSARTRKGASKKGSTDLLESNLKDEFLSAVVSDTSRAKEILAKHPNLRDERYLWGETALHYLAVESYLKEVEFLARSGFDVNTKNTYGDTPLLNAATKGDTKMCQLLLTLGADPNAQTDTAGSVLACAVRSGEPELVELLIKAGARTDWKDDLGYGVGGYLYLPEKLAKRDKVLNILQKYGVSDDSEGD